MPGSVGEVDGWTARRAGTPRAVMRGLRRVVAGGMIVVLEFSTGCYSYVPVSTTSVAGHTLGFTITDAGRVALAPSIGPGATKMEGELESQNDTAYVLRMRSVTYINGQTTPWTNERLVVGKQFVSGASERKFSKKRTVLASVIAVGAVVAFIATRSLFGSGTEVTKTGNGSTEHQ